MKQATITVEGKQIRVTGELNFWNVMAIYQKSLGYLTASSEWYIDFAKLTSSDSSGLALMMEWLKLAKLQSKPVYFQHISADLMAIAKIAGLEKMLPRSE